MRRVRARLAAADAEAGLTLIELLVAAAMSVVLVGAACLMLISAVRSQPQLSEKAQSISTARYVLERMTREIRNGVTIDEASGSKLAFETQVRRDSCGGAVEEDPSAQAIECRVTYTCDATSPPTTPATYACVRAETDPEVPPTVATPTTTTISGLGSDKVFNCGLDSCSPASSVHFVGVTLRIPNPEGSGELEVKDGAGLRTLTFAN